MRSITEWAAWSLFIIFPASSSAFFISLLPKNSASEVCFRRILDREGKHVLLQFPVCTIDLREKSRFSPLYYSYRQRLREVRCFRRKKDSRPELLALTLSARHPHHPPPRRRPPPARPPLPSSGYSTNARSLHPHNCNTRLNGGVIRVSIFHECQSNTACAGRVVVAISWGRRRPGHDEHLRRPRGALDRSIREGGCGIRHSP